MSFSTFQLENFRQFIDRKFEFDQKTVVVGGNGTGKSTLIEAIRLLSVGKSFRTHKLDELIRFDESFFRLQATLEPKNKVELFYGQPFADYPDKERRLTFAGKEISWLEFFGSIPTVIFSPEDVEVVMGGPQVRRRYLDGILWQVNSQFRQDSLELSKVLQERSKLLFLIKINRSNLNELNPWDELLGKLTKKIRGRRQEFVDYINNTLKNIDFIDDKNVEISLKYQFDEGETEELIADEIRLAQNLWGPHRDEVKILLNDRPAKQYASRGQIRTLMMILKTVEASFLEGQLKEKPVVLLDDLFSELDQDNIDRFISRLDDKYQIIATAVELNPIIATWKQIKI